MCDPTTRDGPQGQADLAVCVRRAREGDSAAWTRLAGEIKSRVVTGLDLPPQVDPDEVAVDTLAEVWQAIETLRDDAKILAFASTIARRVAHRLRREADRHRPLRTEPALPHAPSTRNAESEEWLHSISKALEGADEKLFRLLYVVGATSTEVQSSLGISGPRLRKRKYRLHNKLRRVTGD